MNEKYTIENYEEYLKLDCGLFPFQVSLWKTNRIDESKGIVDDYGPITDELYNALINKAPIPFNDNGAYLAYLLENYNLQNTNVFLGNVKITVLSGVDGDSFFDGNDAVFSQDASKMNNARFVIRIKDKFLNSKNGKNEFYETMAHELQHAYRFFRIFLSNNSYNGQETVRMRRYGIAKRIGEISSKPLNQLVSIGYYMSERNEISSESNRLYQYLKEHENINEWNIDEYLEELPLNTIIETLKGVLQTIESNINDKDFVEFVGTTYKKIIKDDIHSPSKALIRFRTRIVDSLMFADRLFSRTISKAFDDFNRRIRDPKLSKNEMDDYFKSLDEILNRNEI